MVSEGTCSLSLSRPFSIASRRWSAIWRKTARSLAGSSVPRTAVRSPGTFAPMLVYTCGVLGQTSAGGNAPMGDSPRHSVSVAAVVVDDHDRALLIRRRDNGHWEPPGGVLELDEDRSEE